MRPGIALFSKDRRAQEQGRERLAAVDDVHLISGGGQRAPSVRSSTIQRPQHCVTANEGDCQSRAHCYLRIVAIISALGPRGTVFPPARLTVCEMQGRTEGVVALEARTASSFPRRVGAPVRRRPSPRFMETRRTLGTEMVFTGLSTKEERDRDARLGGIRQRREAVAIKHRVASRGCGMPWLVGHATIDGDASARRPPRRQAAAVERSRPS